MQNYCYKTIHFLQGFPSYGGMQADPLWGYFSAVAGTVSTSYVPVHVVKEIFQVLKKKSPRKIVWA